MALVLKDRVRESSSTSGTGTITLAGAATGFDSFASIGDGNTTYYAIIDTISGDWEVGLGTYTASGTTLSRDTVLESSNSDTLVNFAANTKDVICTYPADKSVFLAADGSLTLPGALSATGAVTGSNLNVSNWDTAYGWGDHSTVGYLTSYTETDPVYTASSWYTTTNNSSNWDTAYGWGDHASAGYLTSETYTGTVTSVAATVPTGFTVTGSPVTTTGTLAIAFDTGYSLPTTASQTNWDTAHGWGDHASAGYVVSTGDTMTGDLSFGDNNKAIFGAGSDLQIYHNGNHSYISDQGTGELRILATDLRINNSASNKSYLRAVDGGALFLFHNGSSKLSTTSTGIDVTGTVTTDGANLNGAVVINESGADVDFRIESDTNANAFFLEGSNGRVGIGTGSPSYTLDVSGTGRFSDLVIGRNSASTDVNDANDTGSFSVRGSASTVAAMSFHRVGTFAINMGLGTDNIFRIGGWSASDDAFQLNGSGDVTALGDVTAYSDERLKENWKDLPEGFVDNLAGVKSGTYNRIDLDGKQQVGVSAQSLQTVLPDAVIEANDTLAVNYGNAALASAIELAKKVVELEARIKELEGK